MRRVRSDKDKLNGLELRNWKHEIESDVIKNLLGGKEEIRVSALIMT